MFVVYVLVFSVLAWPWLRSAATAIPAGAEVADPRDARFQIWVLGVVAQRLVHDPGRLFDAPMYFPAPAQLTGSDHFLSTQLAFAPVFAATGNATLAASLAAWLSYPIAALAMNRLLVALGVGGVVAWVAGLAFALGPLRAPANLQLLQYLNLYLPVAALASTRLRLRPTWGRASILSLVLLLGSLSGYYLAVVLAVTSLLWTAAEALRREPGRLRFLLLSAAAAVGAVVPLAAVSIPYLGRSDVGWVVDRMSLLSSGPTQIELAQGIGARVALVSDSPLWLGLALIGALALSAAEPMRLLAGRGLILAVVCFTLMLGPMTAVGDVRIPLPFAVFESSWTAFFRLPWRFVVGFGFGTSLLAAAALEWSARARPRVGPWIALAVAFALVATRGRSLPGEPLDVVRPQSAPIYDRVREAAVEFGAGPLLEFPLNDRSGSTPDALVGSLRHGQPLIYGYTGYQPAHAALVASRVRALPQEKALADLVDMTHLRWILLHPLRGQRGVYLRERLVALPGVRSVLETDGWELLRVDRDARNPEWFETLSHGPRRGFTLLGAPLLPVPAPIARIRVLDLKSLPTKNAAASGTLLLVLEFHNDGTAPWPVSVPAGTSTEGTVRARVRVAPVGTEGGSEGRSEGRGRPGTSETVKSLPTDVPPGGRTLLSVWFPTAEIAPAYEIEVEVFQTDGAPFAPPAGRSNRWIIPVSPWSAPPGAALPDDPGDAGSDEEGSGAGAPAAPADSR